jgi:hypothetical protein
MLDEFRLWCKANDQKLKGEPVFAKTRRSEIEDETLTPPLYKAGIDLKTDDLLASFTVWGTGDVQIIIMDNETGKELIVDDRHLQSPPEMRRFLDYYTDLILTKGPFQKMQ